MKTMTIVPVILCSLFALYHCIKINNDIQGEPVIECTDSELYFKVQTEKPFFGRIFAKGKAEDNRCIKENYVRNQTSFPTFSMLFGICGMRSYRSYDPEGMFYVVTLIVSFHPKFVTKVDKAFHVRCFFAESKILITANVIAVSMLSTTEVRNVRKFNSENCIYSIRRGSLEDLAHSQYLGDTLRYAHVGDKIVHVWDCNDPMFGIFLHNCYVSDGDRDRSIVIDNRGCPVDPVLISAVQYSANLTQAYAESHVFKYADKLELYFSCEIQMCMKSSGNCDKLTPPPCATKMPAYSRRITYENGVKTDIFNNLPKRYGPPGYEFSEDSVISVVKDEKDNVVENIPMERRNYFGSFIKKNGRLETKDDGGQLTEKLIIFDMDESVPDRFYHQNEHALNLDVTLSNNGKTIGEGKQHTENLQCVDSFKIFTFIVSGLAAFCCLLLSVLIIVCFKLKNVTTVSSTYYKNVPEFLK